MQEIRPINLREKLARFETHWSPKIVAELNGQQVKLVKLLGEFVWHRHEGEDELFLVLEGELRIALRDGEIVLREGECAVIPRGVEHKPVAENEVHVLLLEPAGTVNTGDTRGALTVDRPEWI